ncbi:response regulator [Flavobacterium sp.]|uniref:response regulator n=1 Tax=Flavobacterium sp. TaxID=239 RepID=UPI0037529BAE
MITQSNILLVDDHLVVRKGIEIILNDNFKNCTVFNSEDYNDALKILQTVTIDLIILDININGFEDIKIVKAIKEIQPNIKILVFTSYQENQYGVRYIQQGANGFLNKFCSEEVLINAIKSILEKGYYYSRELQEKLNQKVNKKNLIYTIDSLSNREYEISKLLVNGYGNLEIANLLNIQMSTVSTYKNRVFEKLNINNIVALSEILKEEN